MKTFTLTICVLLSALSLTACSSKADRLSTYSVDESNSALLDATSRYTEQHYPAPPYYSIGVSGLAHTFQRKNKTCCYVKFTAKNSGKSLNDTVLFCRNSNGAWRVET